jgi:hypothetical protein
MRFFLHELGFLSLLLIVSANPLRGQDMPVRVEAIRLLERANAVSSPAGMLRNYKQQTTFRSYGLDGSTKDGIFNVIYASDGRGYDITFGDFHTTSLHFPDKIVQSDYTPPPMEVDEVFKLTPIYIGRFDKSDTIQSITPATLFGRAAKCIQFETVNGRTRQSNEICVDVELGTLVRWNVGDELIDDTDYSSLDGVWYPAHIRQYFNGKLRTEVEQKFTAIDTPIDWAAMTPPNASTTPNCRQFKRPTIQSAQQPASAGPGPWYDVKVRAVIGEDGHVYNAAVLPVGKAELEQQAIQIVSKWVFAPATCDGKPMSIGANLSVHFPPE